MYGTRFLRETVLVEGMAVTRYLHRFLVLDREILYGLSVKAFPMPCFALERFSQSSSQLLMVADVSIVLIAFYFFFSMHKRTND